MYQETLQRYLDDLASKKPAPGGGSAAALVASIGAGLISMVANFTIGKEKYKDFEGEVKRILCASEALRTRLLQLVDQDVTAYKKVSSAYKLPKDNAEDKKRRTQATQQALKEALAVPLEICKCCHQASILCPLIAEKGNVNLISDVGVAVVLLQSAFQSALINVEINLKGLKEQKFIIQVREILEPIEEEITVVSQEVKSEVEKYLTK